MTKMRKLAERLWIAIFGEFPSTTITPQENTENPANTMFEAEYRQNIISRITNIESLLHYLANRVDLLAKNQKESSDLITQQNSLFEEMLNSTADYVAPPAPEAKPMIGQNLPNLDSQRPPPAPEPPTKKHLLN